MYINCTIGILFIALTIPEELDLKSTYRAQANLIEDAVACASIVKLGHKR